MVAVSDGVVLGSVLGCMVGCCVGPYVGCVLGAFEGTRGHGHPLLTGFLLVICSDGASGDNRAGAFGALGHRQITGLTDGANVSDWDGAVSVDGVAEGC